MKTSQQIWTAEGGFQSKTGGDLANPQLLLVFGGLEQIENEDLKREIRAAFPSACIIGCSTSGEIADVQIRDHSLSITAVQFDHCKVAGVNVSFKETGSAEKAGRMAVDALDPDGLAHLLVLANGVDINGSDLVQGIIGCLPPGVTVTGGLAGDDGQMERTAVLFGEESSSESIAAVGFYGDRLRIGYGSTGGWDPFGPEREITRSQGNILYELDDVSALKLYKQYLGKHADGLPATALLFPLGVRGARGDEEGVVRTVLGVDEGDQSMTFAGDMPSGSIARFMKANFDRIIDGAAAAALTSRESLSGASPGLSVLISCVGRKMVLKQRTEEELEAVREVIGEGATLAGFYSNGEIAPFRPGAKCELHNQTMTVTTICEV